MSTHAFLYVALTPKDQLRFSMLTSGKGRMDNFSKKQTKKSPTTKQNPYRVITVRFQGSALIYLALKIKIKLTWKQQMPKSSKDCQALRWGLWAKSNNGQDSYLLYCHLCSGQGHSEVTFTPGSSGENNEIKLTGRNLHKRGLAIFKKKKKKASL